MPAPEIGEVAENCQEQPQTHFLNIPQYETHAQGCKGPLNMPKEAGTML